MGDDRRSFSYYKAVPVVEKLPCKIQSAEQVKGLPGIGKSMQDHVSHIHASVSFNTEDMSLNFILCCMCISCLNPKMLHMNCMLLLVTEGILWTRRSYDIHVLLSGI